MSILSGKEKIKRGYEGETERREEGGEVKRIREGGRMCNKVR